MTRIFPSVWLAALPLILSGASAWAGNWEWGSRFGLNANWNDNPALVNDSRNPESTFRMLAVYNGEFARLQPNGSFSFRPRITRDYYPDKKFQQLQSTDIFLPGSYRHSRQTSNWLLGWNLSGQAVLSDESTVTEGTDFSQLNADDRVYRASLTPSVSWTFSEKDQVSLGIGASITRYELDLTNRADTDTAQANFSYRRSVTERQGLGFTATFRALESNNTNFRRFLLPDGTLIDLLTERITDGTSDSFTLDYSFSFSPTSSINLKAGLQSTNSEINSTVLDTGDELPSFETNLDSTTYDIAYSKTLRRGNYRLIARRSVSANVAGQPQDRYDIGFAGELDWNTRLSSEWNLRAWQQQNIGLAAEGSDAGKTNFYGADFKLRWKYSQKWSITGRYEFKYRERPDSFLSGGINRGGSAQSNRLFIGLNYNWKTFQKR